MATRAELLEQYKKVNDKFNKIKKERERLKEQIIKQVFKNETGVMKASGLCATYEIRNQDRVSSLKDLVEVYGEKELKKNKLVKTIDMSILSVHEE